MGLLDFLKGKNPPTIEDMMNKASAWTDIYMECYALRRNSKVKGSIFVFTSWAIWHHCLHNNLLPKGDIANQYIASTLVYSGFDEQLDVLEFFEIFKTRFKIFSIDMNGLANSHYPQTKQYLPFATYCTIYQKPFALEPTSGIDPYDYEVSEELHEFTGGLIQYWNKLTKDLQKSYK